MACLFGYCTNSVLGTVVKTAFLIWSLFVNTISSQNPNIVPVVEFQLREEQAPGTYVGNVGVASKLATTLSPSEFSQLKFNPLESLLFKISESNGSLTTATRIDREQVCPGQAVCKLPMDVIVYTRLPSGEYDILKAIPVSVEILDINDNDPKFPADSVILTIAENNKPGEELPTRGAVDEDTGNNSVAQYSFKEITDTFKLAVHPTPDGSTYLGVVVMEALDREVRDFYQVTVVATDGGYPVRTGSVLINITVADVNDNQPEFQQASYNESVPENAPLRSPILRVHATDKDIGTNAEISYQFSNRVSQKIQQKFDINSRTGEISAKSNIDYEEDKLFQFIVEAVDNGKPALVGRTNVNLYVIDKNDNSPQININLPPMGTEVAENEPVGKFIAQVLALDADSGNNGVVTCALNDEHFSLETFNDKTLNMYKIVLAKALDYEQESSLAVTITCTDGGAPPLANSTTFVVNVLDVNDNRPEFGQSTYFTSIMENQAGGEVILQVTAQDRDSGDFGKVSYSLEDKYSGLFNIDSTSGVIKVLHSLDREYIPEYNFHVIAKDGGADHLSSSSLVVLKVGDENDEPPRFPHPVYFGDILENQPAGTFIGNASAIDPDSPEHSKMTYSILPVGTDFSNFSIDSVTGIIRSSTSFDRETKDQYQITIRVVDPTNRQFFSTCNFTVRVLDDNDHSPVIRLTIEDNATLVLQSTTPVGFIITNIFAKDDDDSSSPNSALTFFLQEGDPYQLFNLNRFTGVLTLGRIITARDVRIYPLVIMVKDGGEPPRFDTKQLNVRINGSVAAAQDGSLGQNIIIAITLVGATSVLAIVILITILLIRRFDRQRRRNKANQKGLEDQRYQQGIFSGLPLEPGEDLGSGSLGKKNKKEVSFSLDEGSDVHNTSNGSTQPLTSFKGDADKMELFPTPSKMTSVGSGKFHQNAAMNIPVTGEQQQRRSPLRDEKTQIVDVTKKSTEDAVSQSSGDTDPSDSGRGGSEDDSSHRGSGIDPEHNFNKHYYLPTQHRGSNIPGDHKNRTQPYHQQRLGANPPKSSRATAGTSSKENLRQPISKDNLRQPILSLRSPHSSITSDFESDYSGDHSSTQSRQDSDRPLNGVPPLAQTFGPAGRTANQVRPLRPHDQIPARNPAQDWPNRKTPGYYSNNPNPSHHNGNGLLQSFHGQPGNRFVPPPPFASLSTDRLPEASQDRTFAPSSAVDRPHKYSDRTFPLTQRSNPHSSLSEDDQTTLSGSYTLLSEDLRPDLHRMTVRDSVV